MIFLIVFGWTIFAIFTLSFTYSILLTIYYNYYVKKSETEVENQMLFFDHVQSSSEIGQEWHNLHNHGKDTE